jgi:hypothetical protein
VCRCGFSEREESFPGYDHRVVRDEELERLAGDPSTLSKIVVESGQLFRCPNCGYFLLFDETGFHVLAPVDGTPRLRVPAEAEIDQLGRPLLTADETLRDIREQKLILRPALDVIALIEGAEVLGTVEGAVDASGELSDGFVFHAGSRRT